MVFLIDVPVPFLHERPSTCRPFIALLGKSVSRSPDEQIPRDNNAHGRGITSSTRKIFSAARQMLHWPEDRHFGGLNPPEPVGIPWGLTFPAERSFLTFLPPHLGHSGGGSLGVRNSCSNWHSQLSHTYSNMGIGDFLSYQRFFLGTIGKVDLSVKSPAKSCNPVPADRSGFRRTLALKAL